MIIFYFDTHTS